MNKNPLLSVIIPQYNEEKDISDCLKSLENQTYKKIEIIVVDDGSTDNSLELIKNFSKKIKILQQNHKGPGEARNLGAKNAKGEILIFVDADMMFDKDYLKYLVKPIIEEGVIGTENEMQISTNYNKENMDKIWARCAGKWSFDGTFKNRKIFRAIKKDKFLEMGGFDSSLGYADDQTFFLKYNLRPVIAIGSICYHKNPETLKELYKQNRWMGASIDNKLLKIPIIKHLVPFFLILISPIAIPILSLRKCQKNKDWKILFLWMVIFMIFRYFGTVSGIFRKVYLNKNVR
ncbi:MAG: glycosyltransferase family A protein [archaeon]|nr:glycosyltransferase family A protein [archaeon]